MEEERDPVSEFLDRASPMMDKHDDFGEVVNRPFFTVEMRDAIFGSDHGPEIAYSLGNNPTEADRIAGLAPEQQNREIARHDAEVAREKTAEWMEEERRRELKRRGLI